MLKLKLWYFGHLMWRADSFQKALVVGKIKGERRRGTEDDMFGWHHQLDAHEFEKTLGIGDGQGSLAFCSPWGCKELDMTEWPKWTELWRTVWRLLSKLKTELPYDPAILLLDTHWGKNMVWKDSCTPVFIAALFTIAKPWKQLNTHQQRNG